MSANYVRGTLKSSGSTIVLRNGGTYTLTLAAASLASANRVFTFPDVASDTVALVDAAQTLTNKTLTSPKINEAVALTTTATKLNYLTSAGGTTGTTSTNLVFSTSPTLVTPTLGAASATSINKVVITAPATSSTLTVADGKTLTANASITLTGTDATQLSLSGNLTMSGANALTLTTTDATNVTLPTTGTLATLGGVETFSGAKTFTDHVAVDNAKSMRLHELDTNGSSYVALKAADSLAGNTTWTLPTTDGTLNQVLKTDGTGTLGWANALTSSLANGKIWVGNAVGTAAEVTPTGDVTISNTGVTAIGSGVIVNADVNVAAAIAGSKITAATAAAYGVVKTYAPSESDGYVEVSGADYTILTIDGVHTVGMSTPGVDRTVYLPAASSNTGRRICVVKLDSSVYPVYVQGDGAETINGELYVELGFQYDACELISDGARWHSRNGFFSSLLWTPTWVFNIGGGAVATAISVYRTGPTVTIRIPSAVRETSGTGSTSFATTSLTALPSRYRPSATQVFPALFQLRNGGGTSTTPGYVSVTSGGVVIIQRDIAATAFSTASSCGVSADFTLTYQIT